MQKEKNLLARFLKGRASGKEKEEVESWLDSSVRENNEWQQLNEMKKADLLNNLFEDIKIVNASKGKRWRKIIVRSIVGVAAAVILVLLVPFYYQWNQPSASRNLNEMPQLLTVSTGMGEMKSVELKDGSKVWLNAKSQISYTENFEGKFRDVYLSGQAYFEIKRDVKKPFIVHSRALTIKVLGTSFDLSDYVEDKKASVAVLSGKVSVADNAQSNSEEILDKGELVRLDKKNHTLFKDGFTITIQPSWINNEVVFYHTTMDQVANFLYRNYNMEVRFSDKRIEDLEVSGDFGKIDNIDELLNLICLTINAQYKVSGNDVQIELLN